MKNLVTGAAGFIGNHTAEALLERGVQRFVDWYRDYYDAPTAALTRSLLPISG